MGVPCINYSVVSSTINVSGTMFGSILGGTKLPILSYVAFHTHRCITGGRRLYRGVGATINFPLVMGPMGLNDDINVAGIGARGRLSTTVVLTVSFTSEILIRGTVASLHRVGYSILNGTSRYRTDIYRRPFVGSRVLSCRSGCVNGSGGNNRDGNVTSLNEGVPTSLAGRGSSRVHSLTYGVFGTVNTGNIIEVSFVVSASASAICTGRVGAVPNSLTFCL